MGQRREQKEQTAATVRKAAFDLFMIDGFDKTTIARVAGRSGVAAGTVMLHYGSKSELATAAFTDRIGELVDVAFADLPSTSVEDDLRSVFQHLYAWYDGHAPLSHDLLRESLFSRGPWADRYGAQVAQTLARLTELVVSHVAAGGLDPIVDPVAAAEGIFADYTLTLLAGVRGTFPSVEAQAEHALSLTSQRFG